MAKANHSHLFPIIEAMIDVAVREVEEEGDKIACEAGCDHCCHLLVEVSWEEAVELVKWLKRQPEDRQQFFIDRIQKNAQAARELFGKKKRNLKFAEPYGADDNIPDSIFDAYFYDGKRPCPFLIDGLCAAYEVRPTSCRLHMVVSDPKFCTAETPDDEEYDIPDRLEELKEEVTPVIASVQEAEKWGHMSIMIELIWNEFTKEENTSTELVGH